MVRPWNGRQRNLPTPPEQYVDAADTLYLQPLGFTGTAESSYTPEGAVSALTGVHSLRVKSLPLGQDQQIMISDIENQIAAGGVSPENPVVATVTLQELRGLLADHASSWAKPQVCPATMCTSCWSAILRVTLMAAF